MVRKAPMFETERPELRQKHMRNMDDVVDGFLLDFSEYESGKVQKNVNLVRSRNIRRLSVSSGLQKTASTSG